MSDYVADRLRAFADKWGKWDTYEERYKKLRGEDGIPRYSGSAAQKSLAYFDVTDALMDLAKVVEIAEKLENNECGYTEEDLANEMVVWVQRYGRYSKRIGSSSRSQED